MVQRIEIEQEHDHEEGEETGPVERTRGRRVQIVSCLAFALTMKIKRVAERGNLDRVSLISNPAPVVA